MSPIWSVPVGILLGAALLILLINRSRPNIGTVWFISILAALAVWGWTVSLYFRPDIGIRQLLATASPAGTNTAAQEIQSNSFFILDPISYPYMLAVSALLVILLLTAPSNMEPSAAPRLWFFYLLIETIGFLAVSADNVIFIIYGWVIFDGIDLVTQFLQMRSKPIRGRFLTAIAVRFAGTIMASAAYAYSSVDLSPDGNGFISLNAGIFLLLACALRMGILPISQPYSEMDNSRIGLGTMLRLVSILTVMPVLARIPIEGISSRAIIILSIAGGFASLIGAVGWVLSRDIFSGSSYAALSISGMAFVCTLSGNRYSLIAWGVSVVLTCAPLSLYQIHNVLMAVLASLVVIGFSGLPYTPNAVGWEGLILVPYTIKDLLFILVPALIIGGSFLHIFRTEGRKFSDLEPWMRSVYPLGFLSAIGTHIYIGVISYGDRFNMGVWPASASAFAGGILLAVFILRMPDSFKTQNVLAWGREGISLFWRVMERVLNMEWLIRTGRFLSAAVHRFVFYVSAVLENNGGLIWEFLLLALLVAAAFSGGLR